MATWPTAQAYTTPDTSRSRGAFSHLAFFYRDERAYLSQLVAFAADGLKVGEPVFIAVPGPKGGLVREQLARPGDLLFADIAEFGRNPARIIPEVHDFIARHPGQRVRYIAEPIWPGRSDAEICEATRHEALINLAFSTASATMVCLYDAAQLAPSVVAAAGRTHPGILANGRPAIATRYAGCGQIPPECDRPLPAPPATAATLDYQTNLRQVRSLVADCAYRAGLSDDRVSNLVLAASELAANTVCHTGGAGTVHIWHTDAEVLCQIHDPGWITDPLAGRIRHAPDERGHGLWVVNQMCDLAELRTGRGGTTIRLHMRLRNR
jgi:anti-sigma regulatory factor (Ser/Thr protein kinase)